MWLPAPVVATSAPALSEDSPLAVSPGKVVRGGEVRNRKQAFQLKKQHMKTHAGRESTWNLETHWWAGMAQAWGCWQESRCGWGLPAPQTPLYVFPLLYFKCYNPRPYPLWVGVSSRTVQESWVRCFLRSFVGGTECVPCPP